MAIRFMLGLLMALVLGSAEASLPLANGGLTGQWLNIQRSGEGFFVEVIDIDGEPHMAVSWFTYDQARNQMWLVGSAPIAAGATSLQMPVFITDGALFGEGFDPDDVNLTPWGTLTFEFTDCHAGMVSYDSELGFGSGSIEVARLTSVLDFPCRPPPEPTIVRPGLWNADGLPDVCIWISSDGTSVSGGASGCGAISPLGFAIRINHSFISNGLSCNVDFSRDLEYPIFDDRVEVFEGAGPIPIVQIQFTGESIAVLTYNDGKGCFNEYVLLARTRN